MAPRTPSWPGHSMADLREDSATVRYDLDMLVNAAVCYGGAVACGDILGQNMAVESYAIHCRSMIMFLFGHLPGLEHPVGVLRSFSRPQTSDVFAYDYYPDWQNKGPTPTETMGESKWRADKHVMHITTDRRGINQPGTGKESPWSLKASLDEICRVMADFLAKAPESNFDPEARRKMKELLNPWMPSATAHAPTVSPVATSGPVIDSAPPIGTSAKTDVRTTPLPHGYSIHAKTTPEQ